jgi:hypothetical protein
VGEGAMTLRKLLKLIGEYYDRAKIGLSDLWNGILDAPLWVWVIIGFVIMGIWSIQHFLKKASEVGERDEP